MKILRNPVDLSPDRALRFALFGVVSLLAVPSAASQQLPDGVSANDWAGIRAAYEKSRHSAFPVEGGYRTRNPGQRWHTRFDGRGVLTEPDAAGWSWGMELESYGFTAMQREVTDPEEVRADGPKVTYAWGG